MFSLRRGLITAPQFIRKASGDFIVKFVNDDGSNLYFPEIKKNFGFGCMRLPMKFKVKVDYREFSAMIDKFMAEGFNYFDTAHGYVATQSETSIRDCLVKRYPRESFVLTNKLSSNCFKKEADIRPFFEKQLNACGVDYFDFYLMHAQSSENYGQYKSANAYEVALELKKEGKVRHIGLSFHDKAQVLDMILTENPEVEVVQIQFNYRDYNDAGVQGKECLEVCRKHNKPVIVMEPVKGGALVNLPEQALSVFKNLNSGMSPASYALRFAAGFEGIMMVISGMSDLKQMEDNLSFMKSFEPLSDEEMAAVNKVCDIINGNNIIECTACKYCIDGCPQKINIPEVFACYNAKKQDKSLIKWNSRQYYNALTKNIGKASDCIGCGKCESICPQHLEIRKLLKSVSREFGK